ncbi:MAG: dTDP-4-dehydrorhamnose reductase [Proteobacteria bacterium]|nr:dTDP-4-dehydrorhamnose reductase [Pseudomonadota bacterium]
MRIIIIGAQGQVGWELTRRAPALGHDMLAWDVAELDITDAAAVDRQLAASGVEVVINAAAYTAVDKAEQEPELAFAVNRDGPAHLAAACARLNIPLLHISTDYVYDGRKPGPYVENDTVTPLGVYGASKLAGDEAVRRLLRRHLILRVSWVFGIHGHNFVKTIASAIVELARARESLPVKTVTAITTADYPTPAARPANSVLDCARLAARLGIQPRPWRVGLEALLDVR